MIGDIVMKVCLVMIVLCLFVWMIFASVVLCQTMEQVKKDSKPPAIPESTESDAQMTLTRYAVSGLKGKRYRAFRYCV